MPLKFCSGKWKMFLSFPLAQKCRLATKASKGGTDITPMGGRNGPRQGFRPGALTRYRLLWSDSLEHFLSNLLAPARIEGITG
jgi:hypothetical protein